MKNVTTSEYKSIKYFIACVKILRDTTIAFSLHARLDAILQKFS